MKIIKNSGKYLALLTLVLASVDAVTATPIVSPQSRNNESLGVREISLRNSDSLQLAQNNPLLGQCRLANQGIRIYLERSTSSSVLGVLTPNERVVLSEDFGQDGFIAVQTTTREDEILGFVEARYLAPCNSSRVDPDLPPTAQGGACREVTLNVGIRENPNISSRVVRTLNSGDRVILSNPPEFRMDREGRDWVRIVIPREGWVLNGFVDQDNFNLVRCRS